MNPVFTAQPTKQATVEAARSLAAHRYDQERYCVECGHVGVKFTEDLTEFPEGGWYAMTPCKCAVKEHEQAALDAAEIPNAFRAASVEDWNNTGRIPEEVATNEATSSRLRLIIDKLPEATSDGINLWLYGSGGTGKTYLACAVLRAAICEHGYAGRFISAASLVREAIDRKEEFDALFRADWIVVDGVEDLPETRQGFEMTLVIDLMRHRSHHGLPTIFTSDKPISGLPERLRRIFDPLMDKTVPLALQGKRYEGGGIAAKWRA